MYWDRTWFRSCRTVCFDDSHNKSMTLLSLVSWVRDILQTLQGKQWSFDWLTSRRSRPDKKRSESACVYTTHVHVHALDHCVQIERSLACVCVHAHVHHSELSGGGQRHWLHVDEYSQYFYIDHVRETFRSVINGFWNRFSRKRLENFVI